MKNKNNVNLVSIKSNSIILQIFKLNKKVNLSFITLWFANSINKANIDYALLVNKSNFKHATLRNKIKRQLRNILINSNLKGGIKILFKPNQIYLKKTYNEIQDKILITINKYNEQ